MHSFRKIKYVPLVYYRYALYKTYRKIEIKTYKIKIYIHKSSNFFSLKFGNDLNCIEKLASHRNRENQESCVIKVT